MKNIGLLVLVLLLGSTLWGQNNFNDLKQINVEVTTNNEIIYTHAIQKSETLYSLARFFKIPLQDLMLVNNISKGQTVALGSNIRIPLNPESIITSAVKSDDNWIPIIYKVKKKETLYRIAKTYFNQNIQQLMGRNKLTKLSLALGQTLVAGWWPINGEPKTNLTAIQDTITATYSTTIDSSYNNHEFADSLISAQIIIDSLSSQNISLPKIKNLKGIAIWERTDPNDDFLFVMHKYAKVNSLIKLQHPVTEKVVVAKVVDKLPSGIYTEDVDLIISKAVAVQLGALETRFQVGMTYYE